MENSLRLPRFNPVVLRACLALLVFVAVFSAYRGLASLAYGNWIVGSNWIVGGNWIEYWTNPYLPGYSISINGVIANMLMSLALLSILPIILVGVIVLMGVKGQLDLERFVALLAILLVVIIGEVLVMEILSVIGSLPI
jgi:hypothetical protein